MTKVTIPAQDIDVPADPSLARIAEDTATALANTQGALTQITALASRIASLESVEQTTTGVVAGLVTRVAKLEGAQPPVVVPPPPPPTNVTVAKVTGVSGDVSLAVGKSATLPVKALDAAGKDVTAAAIAAGAFALVSTDLSIASVTPTGVVTGVGPGSANVEVHLNGGVPAWATITVTGTAPAPPPVVPSGQAIAADALVDSIGMATHFSYYDLLPYGANVAKTIASVKSAGIRWIRDGLTKDATFWTAVKQLTASGVRLCLVTQPAVGTGPFTDTSLLDFAVAQVGKPAILAFEGSNEVDNGNAFWGGLAVYGKNAKAWQQSMYAKAKALGITVLGLTTTSSTGAQGVGDISAWMDIANMHPYQMGDVPSAYFTKTKQTQAPLNVAGKPWWVTENGYSTALGATQNAYQPPVSEAAQQKYSLRLPFDSLLAGIARNAFYTLVDVGTSYANEENGYGLLKWDGTPKLAWTALANLIAIMADPGAAFTPSMLGYTLTAPSTVKQALFQKRDGRFYLVLYNDVRVYDTAAKKDVVNPSVQATVTLTKMPTTLKTYMPIASATATRVATALSFAMTVPDHPFILEITP